MTKLKESRKGSYIYVGLNPELYTKIENQYKISTCRSKSEYIRELICNRPITTLYRNQSLDDLIEEIVILNTEINKLKNNISLVIENNYTVQQMSEYTSALQGVKQEVVVLYEKMDQVKNQIEKITNKWLQS